MITLKVTLPSGDELTFKVKNHEAADQVKEEFSECKIEVVEADQRFES